MWLCHVPQADLEGLDSILKNGEKATETVIAAKNGDKEQIIYETADLWFYCWCTG